MQNKILIGAAYTILCFILGGVTMKSCSKPEPIAEIKPDTVRIFITEMDTIKIHTKPRTEFVTVYTDSGANNHECCRQLDDCTEQLWSLANIEVEARKEIQGGFIDVAFSMPIYLSEPSKAFQVRAEIARPDTAAVPAVVYRPESWTDRVVIAVGAGYGIGPTGFGPNVNVTAGYRLVKLSDMWR